MLWMRAISGCTGSPLVSETKLGMALPPPRSIVSCGAHSAGTGGGCGFCRGGRSVRRAAGHLAGGVPDGADDLLVAGAAAEVPLQAVPDLPVVRVGVALEDLQRGQHHPRRTEAALQPVLLPDALLAAGELPVPGQALDREDVRPVGLRRQDRAGFDGQTVDDHGAGATGGSVAADVRAGE